ncbi:hypothetical protein NY2A_b863R [Paramecium bursaria Chlorella virus NY2A]|uniref:Uncharacterized protein b863R n=1 Tax=Paramecium bursaria Chlorella virus NY2A TaxID=46021 RepID=A7IY38_PBCVN|nr:hypothetical protein NY2A_b863R [Paramecium bursaria Chlorella virus NY2A]ABT15262.1 hypothetical protein NY2A_b863R [Paramecium bursaria Chlorella virus NY2A]
MISSTNITSFVSPNTITDMFMAIAYFMICSSDVLYTETLANGRFSSGCFFKNTRFPIDKFEIGSMRSSVNIMVS